MTLFYVFSSLAIVCATMVIRSKNPVHSVLFLILVFCNAAGLLVLIELDFFAMIFLVVYVGAIAVLFLFVVMMLNIRVSELNENILRYLPIGGLIGLIFLIEVFVVVDTDVIPMLGSAEGSSLAVWLSPKVLLAYLTKHGADVTREAAALSHPAPTPFVVWPTEHLSTIEALGQVVYTYFAYYFIVASLILLVAMIGAIVLTMDKGVFVKKQEVYDQNSKEFAKTVLKIR